MQAHAKLMARHSVMQQDAIVAISIAEASVHAEYSLLGGQDALRTEWLRDAEYERLEAHVLDLMEQSTAEYGQSCYNEDMQHDESD